MHRSPLPLLFGLVGRGTAGNPTQQILEDAFESAGLRAQYVTLDIEPEDLDAAIRGLRAIGFNGFHVTMPYKIEVTRMLDDLTERADLVGAVNTVRKEDDRLVGENTDGLGFVTAAERIFSLSDARVLVLGAGGAARAIAVEVARSGAAHVAISNRSRQKAVGLSTMITTRLSTSSTTPPWPPSIAEVEAADVVINATSIGMFDPTQAPSLVWPSNAGSKIAADVVIALDPTSFLKGAATSGYKTLSGIGMLVEQALIGFRWWTGMEANRDVIMNSAVAALATIELRSKGRAVPDDR